MKRGGIFPPLTLEAGRPRWTARDKLARLVYVSRGIGYCNDECSGRYAPEAELAEERALFEELARLLDRQEKANANR